MKTGSTEVKVSRRALLIGAGGLAVGAAIASSGSWPGPFVGESRLQVARFAAMGTFLDFTLPCASGSAVQQAVATIARLERCMTVFSPGSELSGVNASAASARQPVSTDLAMVLAQCRTIHRLTDGAFDPTVGPLMRAWGFRGGRPTRLPGRDLLGASLKQTGLQWVDLSPGGVAFGADGLGLDLGGIGKGYAADRAAEVLRAADLNGLVNVGGDLRSVGAQPDGAPWQVGVRHPLRGDELLARIELAPGQAVATSGTYEQRFEVDGREVTHILDPRSGEPVHSVVSATVVAPSAMEADALATAACVLGTVATMRLVDLLPGVEALLVARDSNRFRVEATGGMKVHMLSAV